MSARLTRSASRRDSEKQTSITTTHDVGSTAEVTRTKRGLDETPDVLAKRTRRTDIKERKQSTSHEARPSYSGDKTATANGKSLTPNNTKIDSKADKTKVQKREGNQEKLQLVEQTRQKEIVEEEEEKEIEEQEAEATVSKKTEKTKRTTKQEKAVEMGPLAARATGLRMFIGAHVSAAKGIHNAITNSEHIGGNAFALFLKSQRKWDNPPLQNDLRDQFKQACTDNNYDASKYVLPHGSYLVNLAQEDPTKAKQAYTSFIEDLKRCEALGIKLYNFHPGATNQSTLDSSLSRIAKALISALDETKTVIPVLETTCGHGTTIGGPLSHFRDLFSLIPPSYHPRLGICIDTCHSFAAGYDIRTPTGWNDFMTEFDTQVGLRFLRAFHLNDSKTPLGSRRDLHANIGTGFLGLRAFHALMNDKRLENIPMILETPIDRPVESDGAKQQPSSKTTKSKPPTKKQKPPTVEDKSIWAGEIKLLESLIGMDPEGEEFLTLEARLAEEGKEVREKQQALFDKKQLDDGKKTAAKKGKSGN